MSTGPADDHAPEPLLRVVRGNPTDEELVALIGALAAFASPSEPQPAPAVSPWASYWRTRRGTVGPPGPGAWRRALR